VGRRAGPASGFYGELLDLQAGECSRPTWSRLRSPRSSGARYESLWRELTREEILRPEEQRYRIAERLRRLNELGFDADEGRGWSAPATANKLRLKTRVAETGHDSRGGRLFPAHRGSTPGGAVASGAAACSTNMAAFRAWLEQKKTGPAGIRGG